MEAGESPGGGAGLEAAGEGATDSSAAGNLPCCAGREGDVAIALGRGREAPCFAAVPGEEGFFFLAAAWVVAAVSGRH